MTTHRSRAALRPPTLVVPRVGAASAAARVLPTTAVVPAAQTTRRAGARPTAAPPSSLTGTVEVDLPVEVADRAARDALTARALAAYLDGSRVRVTARTCLL